MEKTKELILYANKQTTIVDDDLKGKLYDIYQTHFSGIEELLLNEKEFNNLCIKTGTLTEKEKLVMQTHIFITNKMLSKMRFKKYLKDVPSIVSKHHEFLDGSGYPDHLKEDKIPLETRIITIIDIFESLTAEDRPYRKAYSIKKGINIIKDMANKGKLDCELVQYFIDSKIYNIVYSNDNSMNKYNFQIEDKPI